VAFQQKISTKLDHRVGRERENDEMDAREAKYDNVSWI
jgi:hypothetical protein